MRINRLLISAIIIIVSMLLNACAPKMTTKGIQFPSLYDENPTSILILPPMNESTAADAKDYYLTTIQEPLSFCGYYVFPQEVTTDILKKEGIYDAELLRDTPLQKFKEYFGADAVLFTTIKIWNLSYLVIAANLTVSIDCELKSTKSNNTLWKYNGTVIVDLTGSDSGGGIAGLIVKIVATAVISAMADYVPPARQANYMALQSMPFGKYHQMHGKDRDHQFIDQSQIKK